MLLSIFIFLLNGFGSQPSHLHSTHISFAGSTIQSKSKIFSLIPRLKVRNNRHMAQSALNIGFLVTALDKLHSKHVLPGFSDRSLEEREIEALTTDITRVRPTSVPDVLSISPALPLPRLIGLPSLSISHPENRSPETRFSANSISSRSTCSQERAARPCRQGPRTQCCFP